MFIKTLKYDFLFSRDIFLGMAAIMVALSVILRFTVVDPQDNTLGWLFFAVFLLCGIVTVAQVMQFFYKNFFDDTGYLMFTLPVKRLPLFASKVVVSFVWLNLMLLSAFIAGSILTSSFGGIIDAISLELLNVLIEANLIAMFLTLTLYFVVTLANSSVRRWHIHRGIAVAVGFLYVWLFFWLYAALGERYIEWGTTSLGQVRRYDALGEYIGTYDHFTINRPIVGLNVGRIPFGDGHHAFFDIYRWGLGFIFCVVAFLVTYYLLKKRVSL